VVAKNSRDSLGSRYRGARDGEFPAMMSNRHLQVLISIYFVMLLKACTVQTRHGRTSQLREKKTKLCSRHIRKSGSKYRSSQALHRHHLGCLLGPRALYTMAIPMKRSAARLKRSCRPGGNSCDAGRLDVTHVFATGPDVSTRDWDHLGPAGSSIKFARPTHEA
jgi:hypothetical protein